MRLRLISILSKSHYNRITSVHVNALTETTPKQEWFYRWRPLTFFPYSSFLSVFHKFSHLARVSVTTGSMRRYLDPTEVAQAVQRLQDGTLICAIARRFAVSPSTVSRAWGRFQETGSYSGRAGQCDGFSDNPLFLSCR